MKHLFLPYNLALIAKEKGFPQEHILGYFYYDDRLERDTIFLQYKEDCIAAPLYQQIIDWFREKHNLYINIYQNGDTDDEYVLRVYDTKYPHTTRVVSNGCNSYYNELNKAIREAFRLI